MNRVALISSEPLRSLMAGVGIRYLELSRQLAAAEIEVRLIHPGDPKETPDPGDGVEVRSLADEGLASLLAGCDAAVAQGQLANNVALEAPDLPLVVDLYDPWLLENLHYAETLGLDSYRNDHASWVLQLSHGDFFLCSSEEQRDYYLGFLTALGRVNPHRLQSDPDLRALIDVVPFGVPEALPEHRAWLEPRLDGAPRLLFGGVYDWYDPETLLTALDALLDQPWVLHFVRNPNPESTPQAALERVERWLSQREASWRGRVEILDWVPSARRFDLLRDVDLLVATHTDCLETRLSLRTRFLEALAAGCPVMTSVGGTVSRLVELWKAGWVVPQGDAAALSSSLRHFLGNPAAVAERVAAGRVGIADFHWSRVVEPLLGFCRDPRVDSTKAAFAFRPGTVAPADSIRFRLRRKWHSLVRAGGLR